MTPEAPARGGGSAWAGRLAIVLTLLAVGVAIATQFSIGRDGGVPDARAGFVVAVLIFFVAAALQSRAPERRAFDLPRSWEWRLVLVVIGIALLYRIHEFFSFPPGLWYDEAVNGTDAIDLMKHGNHLAVWRASNNGQPTMYFYLLIASIKLFGYTILAMRIVPVVAGMAAVAMFYLLARRLLGPVAALAATGLMAVSRYAVTFSRVSWAASLEPVFEIMAVYFFMRAVDTGRKRDWFMAGGSLAAGLYTYASFRMVPFVMAFFVVYFAAARRRQLRSYVPGLVLYAVSFAIVVLPLAQFVVRHYDQVTERQGQVSVFKQTDAAGNYGPLRNNVKAVVKMMNVRGDPNARHNLPNEPMLDEISAALLVLGMGVAVWSFRDWRRGGLLGWYALALIPSAVTLTHENPSAIRTIGVIPPMFLLIGLAIDVVYRTVSTGRWSRAAFAVLVLALFAWAASINYHVLFDRQAKNQDVYDMFQSQTTKAAETVADESRTSAVYLNDSFFGPATDLLDHGRKFNGVDPVVNVPVPANVTRDATFILDTHQQALERYLVALYPEANAEDVRDRFGRIDYFVVRIPRAAVVGLHRATAEYTASRAGTPAATIGESQLSHTWPQDLPAGVALPFTFSWSGVVRLSPAVDPKVLAAPSAGVTQVAFSSPGAVRLEIDGLGAREGRDSVTLDLPADFPAGLYRYRATAVVDAPGTTKLELLMTGGVRQVVPADALVVDAPTGNGFVARHYQGTEWNGPVIMRSLEPYAAPAGRLPPKFSVSMDGQLDVKEGGEYGFAVDAEWPVAVLVDGRMVADASQPQGWRRVEGTVTMSPGSHVITIRYASVGRTSFDVEWRTPGGDWQPFTGQDVTHPPISAGD